MTTLDAVRCMHGRCRSGCVNTQCVLERSGKDSYVIVNMFSTEKERRNECQDRTQGFRPDDPTADWRRRDNAIIWKSLLQPGLIKRTLNFFYAPFYLSSVSIQSLSCSSPNPADFLIR